MSDAYDLSDLLSGAEVSPLTLQEQSSPITLATGGGVAFDASSAVDGLGMWNPVLRSADADLLPEKRDIDARNRDQIRNDAYLSGGVAIYKNSIVGARYQLNAKPETKILWGKEDPVWESEYQEEVETKFTLWAESPQRWVDAARRNTLTETVRLSVGCHLAGGEVLASSEWMPDDGRPYRFALQMIDPDRLSTPFDRLYDTRGIRNGVERDRRGAHTAYYIRDAHPSDVRYGPYGSNPTQTWKRIPARKPWGRPNILFIFEQMRPDQTRGVAEMASALVESRMGKHFRKTELERAVVASTYAASIESELPDDVMNALGGSLQDNVNATTAWMTQYLAELNAYSRGARNLHMGVGGARIPILAPGTKLKIQNPGAASPSGDKFEQSMLRYIAAALGLSYEQFAHDYTKTNYSSARAAMGETQKTMSARKKLVADETATFCFRQWLEEAINYNQLETLKRRNVPLFYDGLNAEAYSACEWVGAGIGQIDPLKETQAAVLRLKANLSTKEYETARINGGDYRRVSRQIKRERDLDAFYGNPSVYDQDTTDMENSLTATPRDGGDA